MKTQHKITTTPPKKSPHNSPQQPLRAKQPPPTNHRAAASATNRAGTCNSASRLQPHSPLPRNQQPTPPQPQRVAIFGGGIAGLTAAHELATREPGRYAITVYERSKQLGGMARSARTASNMPTEHSWRGIAPFYENFFAVAREIPTPHGSVYDELSQPIVFALPSDALSANSRKNKFRPPLRTSDLLGLANTIGRRLATNRRYTALNAMDFSKQIKPLLSQAGHAQVISMISPGLGLDPQRTSLADAVKFAQLSLLHRGRSGAGPRLDTEGWQVFKAPSSDAWFTPWAEYLTQKGVSLQFEHELLQLQAHASNQTISHCLVQGPSGKHQKIHADHYVLAIDPFTTTETIARSPSLSRCAQLAKFQALVAEGTHQQISFRLGFSESIRFPGEHTVVAFPDSEWNITLYAQEHFWWPDCQLGTGVKGLWSGTVCVSNTAGKKTGRIATAANKNEFMQEILHQISRSKQFNDMIQLANQGRSLASFKIVEKEIWEAWRLGSTPNNPTTCSERKWVTTMQTQPHRPHTITHFANLFLAGSHTDTSLRLWSMEGAVESGKAAAHALSLSALGHSRVQVRRHHLPRWMTPLAALDDVLYQAGLSITAMDVACATILSAALWLASYGLPPHKNT